MKAVMLNFYELGRTAMRVRTIWQQRLLPALTYSPRILLHYMCVAACINETLYNLETGEVICFNEPLYGEGQFPSSGQHFNEAGYAVGIPPCL